MARYLALTCEALARTVYAAAARTPHTVTVRLFRQGLHNRPKGLRQTLQEEIDTVEAGIYDAILLAYGMCGLATVALSARHTPIVTPRAHDCITLYLGSRARYDQEFARHPGTYWYSVDYMERQEPGASTALGAAGLEQESEQYEKWVEKWGKETADSLLEEMRGWSRHYTRAAFIDMGQGDAAPFEQMARDKAQQEGWLFERMAGNPRLLMMLLAGEWPEDEFLFVPPGHTIQQSHGDSLVKATPAP